MATGGGTVLTNENKNYTRAIFLVVDLGTEAVKEVFDKIPIFEPKVLSKNIELNRKSNEMKAIPPFLRKILYPSENESKVWNSSEFDLTMMVTLLNKLYTPPPSEVLIWDATKDNIKVIKENRNKLAHSNASVSDQSFHDIWRDTSNAILSLVDVALKPRYQQKMQHLLQMTIDDGVFNTALSVMEHIRVEIGQLQVTQRQHGAKITGLQDTQRKHSLQISELQTEVKRQKVEGDAGKDIGMLIKKDLKDKYRDEMAFINCNPLEPDEITPIDELFVPLTWIHEDMKHKPGQEKKNKPLQHYRDIFEDQSEKEEKKEILRILIKGKPGMGKTTFTKHLAVDWAQGIELSERFENVFVLILRKVQPGQTLVEVIAEQLLPYKSPLVQHLETYIDQNNTKCLFLFDGLDEMKEKTSKEIDEMIKCNYLKNTCLVITSRPTQAQHLTTKIKIDQHARIEGFSKENVKSFIAKFFDENVEVESDLDDSLNGGSDLDESVNLETDLDDSVNWETDLDESVNWETDLDESVNEESDLDESVNEESDPDESVNGESDLDESVNEESDQDESVNEESDQDEIVNDRSDNTSTALFKEIMAKGMLDIAKIPLILNILCLICQDKANRSLPENMSKIYQRLLQLLCKRQKDNESENETELEDILIKLGRIAFEGLMKENNQLYFEKKKIQEDIGEDALKVGLVCIEKAKYKTESNTQVYFLHKSFQENVASCYLGKETDKNNDEPWEKLKNKMKTMKDIGEQDLLLQFCAGASQKLAEQILDFLDEKMNEIDSKLKVILQSLEKLSQNKDLSIEELETVCRNDIGYQVTLEAYEVKKILELEAKCLSNMEKPKEIRSHVVNQVISNTENVEKAFQRNILKPAKKCIVTISNDKELERLVQSTTSVSWIKLWGERKTPYSLTKRTVRLLREMCDRNEHQVSVCIGWCKADCTTMSKVIQLLQSNTKIKYKLLTFSSNRYGREGWEKVFQILSGIRYLIALDLWLCGLPVSVLATIGQIINKNADTFLRLDLTGNHEIREYGIDELSENIKIQLSLTVLKLAYCMNPSDINGVRNLLKKCQHIKVLDISNCECEISEDILKLKNIKNINIEKTVNKDTRIGLNVRKVLANLDKFEMLEVIDASFCQIDDAQMLNIPFNKPSKIRRIHLDFNRIGSQGLQYLCEHHTMLQELDEIFLCNNEIGDEGGQVLLAHLQLFKNMGGIWVGDNRMSEEMKKQLREKGNEYGIDCMTDY